MRILLPFVPLILALPDIAPNPRHRAGIDLAPRETTAVAMRAEVVEITLHPAHAAVRAVFDLENTSDAAEELEVGFPTEARPSDRPVAAGLQYGSNLLDDGGTIYAFVATIDGEPVAAERKSVQPDDPRRRHRHWVVWPMRFDAGQHRRVEVRYEVETRDATYVRPYGRLQPREVTYVLKTGRGWKDAIGSARVLLRCAEDVTLDLVERAAPAPRRKGEKEWEWRFEDFEPDEDITVRYRAYRDAEDALAKVEPLLQQRPEDAELLLDWAENKAALGEHCDAAQVFTRLVGWDTRRMTKGVYGRLYGRPAEYLAARSFWLAGDVAATRRWLDKAFGVVGPRLESARRDVPNAKLRDAYRDTLDRLEKTHGELVHLRVELEVKGG